MHFRWKIKFANTVTGGQAWDAIYKTLYESLTRFRTLLGNGPKLRNKNDLVPHFRCVLMRSGCFWGFLFLFLSCLPTVKTQKSLETPQKHPAACDIVSHTPIVWAANGELYLGDESVSHFIISKHSKQMSTGRLCSPVEVSGPRIDLL